MDWFGLACVLLALQAPIPLSPKPSPTGDKTLEGEIPDDLLVSDYVPGRMLGTL